MVSLLLIRTDTSDINVFEKHLSERTNAFFV